jgi:beta-lactam-binding protein with PASTA domain
MVVNDSHSSARMIAGRYRLGARLGSSLEAAVFESFDEQLQRAVVLKLVHPDLSDLPELQRQFNSTMPVAAALHHPNIAELYDWGRAQWNDRTVLYVATERLLGGSLRDLLDRGRLLSPSQSLVVGLDACKALDALHRGGLVHTDVRPSTLVFGDDRRLRLVDAGLAQVLHDAVDDVTVRSMDRAKYSSPEEAQGQPVLPKSDVYSLCLSLLEAVTGVVPFEGESTVATLANRVDRLMPVSADFGQLAAVFERAGRPDAHDRYTAAEFGRALVQSAEKMPRPAPLPILAGSLFGPDGSGSEPVEEPTGPLARPMVPLADPVAQQPPPPEPAVVEPVVVEPAVVEPVEPAVVEPVVVEPVEPAALPLLVAPTVHQPAEPKVAEPASADPVPVEPVVAVAAVAPVVVAEPVAAAAELAEPQSSLPAPAPLVAPVMALQPLLVAPPAASAPVESPATSASPPVVPTVVPPVVPPPVVPAEPGVDDVFDPADEFPEHAPSVGGSRRWFLALLVVMAVGGGVLAWYNTRPETSVVPELAGLRQGAALNQLGPFEATIIEEASETVEPGVVIRSEPAAGTTLENGSKITLVVSTGPAPRALPELVGLTLADATAQLGELGLVLIEAEPQFDEVVVPGVVLSWSVPAAPTLGVGATVTKGTTVQVVLSAGPAPRSVPALAGLTFEDATKVLQDLGLVIFRVPDEFDVNVPAGTVIRQDIPAGSAVERGAQVSVAVSKGQDVIVMPALAGLDYNTIVAALQGAGFVIGSVVGDTTQAFQSATVNAAPVVDAQQFLRGTKVDLTFAPTPAPVVTVVPGG